MSRKDPTPSDRLRELAGVGQAHRHAQFQELVLGAAAIEQVVDDKKLLVALDASFQRVADENNQLPTIWDDRERFSMEELWKKIRARLK